MSPEQQAYAILTRVHVNRWDEELQRAVPGWDVKARWLSTGTILPVFLPDGAYTPENLDRLIRGAGAKDEAIHALGG